MNRHDVTLGGTVTREVLSSRNQRKKEDRIGESQPFRERTYLFRIKFAPRTKWNLRPSAYKADALATFPANYRMARAFLLHILKVDSLLL
jgi:hypothetical protein